MYGGVSFDIIRENDQCLKENNSESAKVQVRVRKNSIIHTSSLFIQVLCCSAETARIDNPRQKVLKKRFGLSAGPEDGLNRRIGSTALGRDGNSAPEFGLVQTSSSCSM